MKHNKSLLLISKNLNLFFNQLATKEAKSSGFIKRNRKITGSSFLKMICFGNISNPKCSLENMCQNLSDDLIDISKQGLYKRFTDKTVEFMSDMFNHATALFKNNLPIDFKILQQFNQIKLLDSTYIKLPNCMKDQYKGCGSRYKDYKRNESSIKLQLSFDYLNGSISSVDIKEGIRSDQGYRDYLENIKPNDLSITDLGYFVPESFKKIFQLGAYFISRYKADTNLYSSEKVKDKIDLGQALTNHDEILQNTIYLGLKARLPVRIIYELLPEEAYQQRLRKANNAAKKQGHKVSDKNKELMRWSIFVSNVPQNMLTDKQIILLYKTRWQIELLFKLYKSEILLTELKGRINSARILCEFYAKLTIIAIFHGMVNCLRLKNNIEISMTKAMQELRRRSRELMLNIGDNITKIKQTISAMLKAWSLYAIKDKCRKKRVSNLRALSREFT